MTDQRDSELFDYFRKIADNRQYRETHCEWCGEYLSGEKERDAGMCGECSIYKNDSRSMDDNEKNETN